MVKAMPSLSWVGIKKNPSLIPLFIISGVGASWAGFYIWRLATKNPDVSWRRHSNPEPWNEYENKQYKFFQFKRIIDHETYQHPRPRF